jgi:UDP-N-acetylmuramate dehydrogenase
MKISENISLKEYNQYGVEVNAKYLIELSKPEEIKELLSSDLMKEKKKLILGDGNNILFRKYFDGVIIKPQFKGRKIVKEDEQDIWVKLYSGEDWEEFVKWAVSNNYQGVENMTLIPSSIGGAVSQNIAAYGQNIMDVVTEVETINIITGEHKTFNNKECEYTYRNSVFKSQHKNEFLIICATFKLNKVANELETSYHERESRYGSIESELSTFSTPPYSIQDVMKAVENIRNRKLPSVKEYGTCGSVFANPLVSKEDYLRLSNIMPELQSYPVEKLQYTRKEWAKIDEESVKIPAGRLIDELGWLGKWEGNVGVYNKHALCIVTNRKATGEEIYNFLEKIRKDVKDKYDVELTYEINII